MKESLEENNSCCQSLTLITSHKMRLHCNTLQCNISDKNVKISCFFEISDNEIPVFSVASITDISQNTDAGESYATVTWTVPTATDNSGNAPTVTASHTPGQFPIGTYTVVYTAKDAADNTATLSFTIIITG